MSMRDLAESNHAGFRNSSKYYYGMKMKKSIDVHDYLNNIQKHLMTDYHSIYFKDPWTHVNFYEDALEICGWKIHISATYQNHLTILDKVAAYAAKKKISFKFATNLRQFIALNSKDINRVSSGKFIVLYPKQSDFKVVIEDLSNMLKGYKGPHILSDRPYKNSKVVFYRYGEINPIRLLDEYGTITTRIIDDKNKLFADKRVPYFDIPDFVVDDMYEEVPGSPSKLLTKYSISESLHFSAQGGVYSASFEGRKVVIKEARQFCGLGFELSYGTDTIKKEYRFLKELEHLNCAPKPIELLEDEGNVYLVQEYVEGASLARYSFNYSPYIQAKKTDVNHKANFSAEMDALAELYLEAVMKVQGKGIVFGDVSPRNVIYDRENGSIKFIDFEGADYIDDGSKLFTLITPGFSIESEELPFVKELRQIARVLIYCVMPLCNIFDLDPRKEREVVDLFLNDEMISHKMHQLLSGIIDNNFENAEAAYNFLKGYGEDKFSLLPAHTCETISYDSLRENMKADIISIKNSIIDSINVKGEHKQYFSPADPMLFNTNKYCFGFGIFGIMYALKNIENGRTVDEVTVKQVVAAFMREYYGSKARFTHGFFVGTSGIAASLYELGFIDEAIYLFEQAMEAKISMSDIAYGKAGRIICALYFYDATKNPVYLKYAEKDAENILEKRVEKNDLYYWPDEIGHTYVGYTRGSSGIALAFLEVYRRTGQKKYLEAGYKSLEADLVKMEYLDELGFWAINSIPEESNRSAVYSPYIHNGVAGIGTVLLKYYNELREQRHLDVINNIIDTCDVDLTLFPGYLRGLTGIITFLQDCAMFPELERVKKILQRYYRTINLFKVQIDNIAGYAGDELYRISNDLLTGSSGIILGLSRELGDDFKPNKFILLSQ